MDNIGAQSPQRPLDKKVNLSDKRVHELRRQGKKFSANPRSSRRNLLYNELQLYGISTPRENSKLCQRFIGGENIPIAFIAQTLHEMDYLSQNTAYHELMNMYVQAHREFCQAKASRAEEADVFAKLSVEAKHTALSQHACVLIRTCHEGFCLADEIGSNQIILPSLPFPATV